MGTPELALSAATDVSSVSVETQTLGFATPYGGGAMPIPGSPISSVRTGWYGPLTFTNTTSGNVVLEVSVAGRRTYTAGADASVTAHISCYVLVWNITDNVQVTTGIGTSTTDSVARGSAPSVDLIESILFNVTVPPGKQYSFNSGCMLLVGSDGTPSTNYLTTYSWSMRCAAIKR